MADDTGIAIVGDNTQDEDCGRRLVLLKINRDIDGTHHQRLSVELVMAIAGDFMEWARSLQASPVDGFPLVRIASCNTFGVVELHDFTNYLAENR